LHELSMDLLVDLLAHMERSVLYNSLR